MKDLGGGSPDPYRTIAVEVAGPANEEKMGTKHKFWCQPVGEDGLWLFKYPRPGSGEHWAEKIAAELAGSLDIRHAVVELATADGKPGSISKSFASGGRVLLHGNELLARIMEYDKDKWHGQSDHSLGNIFRVLQAVFRDRRAAEIAKRQFASYLVLDALIGNTDRHHQNWGLLVERTPKGRRGFLAPTFDHASSLGRDISDKARTRRLGEGSVGRYAERGRGRVFRAGSARYGPSPLNLLRVAATDHADLFRPALTQVSRRRPDFEPVVRRVPDDWMSPTAKDFTVALLDYNATQLEQCMK